MPSSNTEFQLFIAVLIVAAFISCLIGGVIMSLALAWTGFRSNGKPISKRLYASEIVAGLIVSGVGFFGWTAANVPGAGEGGLLTLFLMLIGILGITIGPAILLAGVTGLIPLRFRHWLQLLPATVASAVVVGIVVIIYISDKT